MLGLGLGLGLGVRRAGFSPSSLFTPGTLGFWFDPNDLSTVFQDSGGTTPGVIGQPVGLIRDKSGGGNHASQATAASRPILRQNATTGALYLEFDGVDDGLATGAINLTATDEVTLFAGVRKLNDAVAGTVAELSASAGANSGTFRLRAPELGTGSTYGFLSRGTAGTSAESGALAAPNSAVLTGRGKISTDTGTLRVNGAQVGTSAADQGSGNFGTYPLYIGRRGGADLPLVGHIYGLTGINRLATAAEITGQETWLNQRIGAF